MSQAREEQIPPEAWVKVGGGCGGVVGVGWGAGKAGSRRGWTWSLHSLPDTLNLPCLSSSSESQQGDVGEAGLQMSNS